MSKIKFEHFISKITMHYHDALRDKERRRAAKSENGEEDQVLFMARKCEYQFSEYKPFDKPIKFKGTGSCEVLSIGSV